MTKEMIIDLRRKKEQYVLGGTLSVKTIKYLATATSEDLTWSELPAAPEEGTAETKLSEEAEDI